VKLLENQRETSCGRIVQETILASCKKPFLHEFLFQNCYFSNFLWMFIGKGAVPGAVHLHQKFERPEQQPHRFFLLAQR
jgi:hypothetical protein